MGDFTILPAVDLKGGQCVRLRQGRADDATVYGNDPAAQARDWARQGATWLHVVDLDGAYQGLPVHLDVIGAMAQAHALAALQVHRRQDREIAHGYSWLHSMKLLSIRRPACWLFSGWNCTAAVRPRQTAEAYPTPYSVSPASHPAAPGR